MNLQSLIPLVLKASIFLTVFALGLQASFADATFLFRRPRLLIRGFFAMNVIMPALALFLALSFHLNPAVKIALVALSVSPVPPFFPKKGLKAGGKEDYTIGLLVATVVLAIVAIPITMVVFERVIGLPLSMSVMSVATIVFMTALAPLLAGIVLRSISSALADRVTKPIGSLAGALMILSVLPVLFNSIRNNLSLFGDGTLLSLAAFALIGYVVGHLLGGPDPEDRSVLALATASRHPAIAVAIAHANFPQQKLVLPAVLIYLIISGIVTSLASKLMNRTKTPVETTKPGAEAKIGQEV
jgi:bile acid:Na+ symporter, BASS family